MKASVIIPAYNSEKTLNESVQSALLQGDCVGEIIIIVNGCTDSTPDIARSLSSTHKKIRVVESAKGKVPARNLGLRLATNEVIALLDADDIWHPHKIEKQLKFMLENSVGVLGTQMRIVGQDMMELPNQVRYPTTHDKIRYAMLKGANCLANSSVIFRSYILEYAGNYDDCFPYCEDYHLWLKFLKFARFANLDEVLLTYRFEHKNDYNPMVPRMLAAFYTNMYVETGVVSWNG